MDFCFGWFWRAGHARNCFQNNHYHHLCTRKQIQGSDSLPLDTISRKELRKPLRSPTSYENIIGGKNGFMDLTLPGEENLRISRIILIFVLLFTSLDLLLPYW